MLLCHKCFSPLPLFELFLYCCLVSLQSDRRIYQGHYYEKFKSENLSHKQTISAKIFASGDQRIVVFPANRNRNRFAEATSVRIGIGIVCEFQNLRIGIGIRFIRWEIFANNSQIPDIFFF